MYTQKSLIIPSLVVSALFATQSTSMDPSNSGQQPAAATESMMKTKEDAGHLDISTLCGSIRELNAGEKDVCFMPMALNDTEKLFLTKLKMVFPEIGSDFGRSGQFGASLDAYASLGNVYSETINDSAKKGMIEFFQTYTNASELGNELRINGPELLSTIILEYSHKLLNEFNKEHEDKDKIDLVNISLKAQQGNDVYANYKRWHYDGPKSDEKADLNFAGVFVGKPTVFAPLMEKEKEENFRTLYNRQMGIPNPINYGGIMVLADKAISLLEEDQKKYPENSDKYKSIGAEIQNVKNLIENMDSNNATKIVRLYHRITRQEFMQDELRQPEKHHVALFTMRGRNPALHSEADMSNARLFFGLRAYKGDKAKESYANVSRYPFGDPSLN